MKAEIVCVGTELLLGDILNTNAQYISRRLADMGIDVYYQTVVGDNNDRVKKAYKAAFERADFVITTGGLGPTQDDLTKENAAEYFKRKLVFNEECMKSIEEYFKRLNRPMSESNKKQAMLPEGAVVMNNNHGTAPGCIIDDGKKIIALLPGPPREMTAMFEESVVPYLKKYIDGVLVSKTLRLCGIGEGSMAERVGDLIDNGKNPTVAPYAKEGGTILRITAKGKDEEEAKKLIVPVENEIRNRLEEYIYGEGEEPLESVIGKKLIDKKLTISTAESCTGGMVAAKLINYPGISEAFLEGAVTYSNEAKVARLGVKTETLDKFGAVSKETAYEMAEGIAKASGTKIGISTTGIAGPGGGTDEKPVGLVYAGLYINGKVLTRELHFTGERQVIRHRTVMEVLNWLRQELNKLQ